MVGVGVGLKLSIIFAGLVIMLAISFIGMAINKIMKNAEVDEKVLIKINMRVGFITILSLLFYIIVCIVL
ncbi:MAG: hypothetical protein K0R54_710 [Clostridiaceae bacterium]|jgi:hypothetical protein|nr:hypothetical protein [Clostridiaceae bacterium]